MQHLNLKDLEEFININSKKEKIQEHLNECIECSAKLLDLKEDNNFIKSVGIARQHFNELSESKEVQDIMTKIQGCINGVANG